MKVVAEVAGQHQARPFDSLGVMASTIHNTRRLERTGIIRQRDTRPGRTETIDP